MTLLGNKHTFEEDEEIKNSKYSYAIYKKEDENESPLPKCFMFSAILVFFVRFSLPPQVRNGPYC